MGGCGIGATPKQRAGLTTDCGCCPVITKVPEREKALRLWDTFVTLTELEEFWELKRTRTRRPEFGERP